MHNFDRISTGQTAELELRHPSILSLSQDLNSRLKIGIQKYADI